MKQYTVPVVFGLGLLALIIFLVMQANSAREVESATELQMEIETTQSYLPERQDEYNRIQQKNPELSEEELMKLPEVQELLDDSWNPLMTENIIERMVTELPMLKIPSKEYPVVKLTELQDACGYIKYRTNIDENYQKLVELLPAYISHNGGLPVLAESDIITIYTTQVNNSVDLVCLSRSDDVETRILVVQKDNDKTNIQEFKPLKGVKALEAYLLESCIILNTRNPIARGGTAYLLAESGDGLAIKSTLSQDEIMSMFQVSSNRIEVKLGTREYDLIIDEENQMSLRKK